MDWVRGEKLGHGSFATVSLAYLKRQSPLFPQLMAVKSCGVSHSSSLVNEKSILEELNDCPQIIQCFGDSLSNENGEKLYNVLLEYASGGDLANKVKNSDKQRLPEIEARQYTKALLKGLNYIHKFGYVHCDIKLQNILLSSNGDLKIADFGLAKRAGEKKSSSSGFELRGTPMYMSPESVMTGELESPADIWALGCAVLEMITGDPVWKCSDISALLMKIGVCYEIPEIPCYLSYEVKDFLHKCFEKDPTQRWTAEMLLNHPFLLHDDDDVTVSLKEKASVLISPNCPFGFPDWSESDTCSITSPEYSMESESWSNCPATRLRDLVSDEGSNWFESNDWVTIR